MRALISLSTRSAIIRSRSDSSRPASTSAASPIDISQTSAMRVPVDGDGQRQRLQPGAAARRRTAPPACSPRSARAWLSLSASECRRCRYGMTPS